MKRNIRWTIELLSIYFKQLRVNFMQDNMAMNQIEKTEENIKKFYEECGILNRINCTDFVINN